MRPTVSISADHQLDQIGLFDTPAPRRSQTKLRKQCRFCGEMTRIAVLADICACSKCAANIPNALQRLRNAAAAAEGQYNQATERLEKAATFASKDDVERYAKALEARNHPRFREAWAAAIARNDGLTPLLLAHEARAVAEANLNAARLALTIAEQEVN